MRPELREELLRRAEKDQAARKAYRDDWQQVAAVDAENLPWLEGLINEVGWPGRSLVGEDGAHAAWLLVQHADASPAFQRRCLDLMTEAVERAEATRRELAYLTDRVLLAEGQPQEYGTQMSGTEDGWTPKNLRDPGEVESRRAAVSLGPMSEHLERINRNYGAPKPSRLTCLECGEGIDVWLPDEGDSRDVRCPACGWETTVTVGPRSPAGKPPGEASR
jgi:DNA-directed RNA polymerase subunit RPC12/RpoP